MKTATEWLFDQLWETPKDKLNWYAILQQAKEMEREQVINSYHEGYSSAIIIEPREYNPEQYYQQTFGK
jgi:hypothetical protein